MSKNLRRENASLSHPLNPNEKVAARVMRLFTSTKHLNQCNNIPAKNEFDDKFHLVKPVIISFHKFFHLQESKASWMIIANRQFFFSDVLKPEDHSLWNLVKWLITSFSSYLTCTVSGWKRIALKTIVRLHNVTESGTPINFISLFIWRIM